VTLFLFGHLGSAPFDELTLIPDIDDVYLYFEQLIFYRERGPQAE
jgi:hypothetical protein